MKVEFQPKEAAYKGERVFPVGSEVFNMGIFVSGLPKGAPVEEFNLSQYKKGPYEIWPKIKILPQSLLFMGRGKAQVKVYSVAFEHFRLMGLPVVIELDSFRFPGMLFPKDK